MYAFIKTVSDIITRIGPRLSQSRVAQSRHSMPCFIPTVPSKLLVRQSYTVTWHISATKNANS